MESQKNKVLDLSDVSDENFEGINRGINNWRASGEGMHMITDSSYTKNIANSTLIGFSTGLISAAGAVLLIKGARKAWPKIKEFGSKIKAKFKK